jgi:cytochrome c oxidase subunit 1
MSTITGVLPLGAADRPEGIGNHAPGMVRTCDTTGFSVCLVAQKFIKLHAVLAVVFLLVGAVAALLLALTRWPTIHLLPAEWYYRILTLHGMNMLIFWILFMEMAILYFAGPVLLNSRVWNKGMAWAGFALMAVGSVMVNVVILAGKADVLMTSYTPLRAHQSFYLGTILVAVGVLLGVANFFGTIWIAKRDRTYSGSLPLVVYGALAAAIIAVSTILHGAAILVPTWLWSINVLDAPPDPALYRLVWWGFGHPSQQVNVCAHVAVWYLLATITVGAKPLNETVCRGAFVLYVLFINLAAAHHLLVDPGVSAGWKIWNTSYAMYLAVLASMIHGYTVPASIEVSMRGKGHDKGLFGWLLAAPWRNPGFSAMFLSLVMFGFVGGITGVTLGTQQINIIAHNTLRIPGHFHATVAAGTSLAFMGLCYYVVPLIFQREYRFKTLARWQPYLFSIGIMMVSFGMSFAGSYGVPRRHWDVSFTGATIPAGFDSGAYVALGLLGIGGIVAFVGLLAFILLTVIAVFTGPSNAGRAMDDWGSPIMLKRTTAGAVVEDHRAPGTMALVLVLLGSFAVYYFANWKALADVWHVR